MKKKYFLSAALLALAAVTFTSCSDDDDNNGGSAPQVSPSEVSFVVASGDPVKDLSGGIRMKVYSDLTQTREGESVYADSLNERVVRSYDGFTQMTYNASTGIYTGYIYARSASAQGIGALKAGLRSYKVQDGRLVEIASPYMLSNFGNTGTFGSFSYAAQISNPVAAIIDAQGAGRTVDLTLPQYAIDEVNPSVSNIIDMGDGQVAMVVNYSNRDSAAVAICDYSLNIKKFITDGRIGASVGAMRSVRYTQSGADDEGNVYVFSGSATDDGKVGALRIRKGTTEFDKDYHFDILKAAGGYRFRKAFHISGDKFLLEFYLAKDKYGNMDASGKLAVVDMSEQTLKWVTGVPDPTTVSYGWGDGYAGSYYLPIAAPTGMSGGSGSGGGKPKGVSVRAASTVTPTIYRIDAETAAAVPFMTFKSSDLLKAITILKK